MKPRLRWRRFGMFAYPRFHHPLAFSVSAGIDFFHESGCPNRFPHNRKGRAGETARCARSFNLDTSATGGKNAENHRPHRDGSQVKCSPPTETKPGTDCGMTTSSGKMCGGAAIRLACSY